jgi:hypothetical protein
MRYLPIAFCIVLACGGPSKVHPPQATLATPSPADEVLEEAAQVFFESGQLIIDAGGDCDRMASSVGAWIDNTRARRHELKESLLKLDTENHAKRYRDFLAERLDIVVGVQVALEACLPDKDFLVVWERMGR